VKTTTHQVEYRAISELNELEGNPRTIKKDDFERLKKSLQDNQDYFEARPIILSDRTGKLVIIAGNQRYKAAKAIGMTEVPTVLLSGLTEEREREIVIRDNVENGEWDMDALANEWDTQELTDWGLDLDWDDPEQEVIEDEAPEANESEPADSVLGGVYQLGDHRLMCGDSTDAGSVAILMNGQKADMVFTDPPYGVSIKGKYTGGIKNDDLRGEELREFLSKTNSLLENYNKGDAYICYEGRNSLEFFESFGRPNELICINKSSASFYNKNRYNRKFELIMFFGEKINADSEVNVWDTIKSSQLQSVDENGVKFSDPSSFCCVHPTAKPVSVPKRAINNSSRIGEICLDLFGGSGSTLIACEQLGRKCYMMELDPKYCDVIRKRYWKFTTGSEDGWQEGTAAVKVKEAK
jgi:DNA modification methylase